MEGQTISPPTESLFSHQMVTPDNSPKPTSLKALLNPIAPDSPQVGRTRGVSSSLVLPKASLASTSKAPAMNIPALPTTRPQQTARFRNPVSTTHGLPSSMISMPAYLGGPGAAGFGGFDDAHYYNVTQAKHYPLHSGLPIPPPMMGVPFYSQVGAAGLPSFYSINPSFDPIYYGGAPPNHNRPPLGFGDGAVPTRSLFGHLTAVKGPLTTMPSSRPPPLSSTTLGAGNTSDLSIKPYARSPRLKHVHKLAERKRRLELKTMFVELGQLLSDHDRPLSKSEIVKEAIDLIDKLTARQNELLNERQKLRNDMGEELGDVNSLVDSIHNN